MSENKKNTGTLKITTPTDRAIAMTRVFEAPRTLVFNALTKPELVKRWLLGPPGWSMPVCEIDLKVGGAYPMCGDVTLTEPKWEWAASFARSTILYESREARDAVLESGMERGVSASYDRLAEMLAPMA